MDETYTFERGYVSYPEACAGSPAAKAPYRPVPPGLIPVERYYTAEAMEAEFANL